MAWFLKGSKYGIGTKFAIFATISEGKETRQGLHHTHPTAMKFHEHTILGLYLPQYALWHLIDDHGVDIVHYINGGYVLHVLI